MTLIGMLHRRKDPTTVFKSYAYAISAKAEGAEFVFFTPKSVDFEKQCIYGKIYENGEWLDTVTRFPDVIYNASYVSSSANDIVDKLQEVIPFTSYSIGDKLGVNDRLKVAKDFSQYLIPSEELHDWEQFIQQLSSFKEVVVKPVTGNKGKGIYFIKKLADAFLIGHELEEQSLSLEQLKEFFHNQLEGNDYLLQPYIRSVTKSGNSLDFRLHVQKNGQGKWVSTSIYPRIAPPNTIVTNISNGGYTSPLESLLYYEYNHVEAFNIKRTLEYFSVALAKHLDEIQKDEFGEELDELGIDVGIDQKKKLWIYEVNWRPGCPPLFYLELDVVRNTIHYAMFLVEKQKREHIKKQQGKRQTKNVTDRQSTDISFVSSFTKHQSKG
ncbi:YheC/YheD family protein [Anaerobacillus alkaliphilus]|uniref:YheC/YheD family protein n=1 Tax=Anaerobacillus alkaliphilus TaxID=1548597 RepID=A0A4Q0VMV5_9BACI|nr:YheC/YheD family protein [Anaerobacillus alkaliphilus]RXI96463.1 YheC/YheD family protein [Anaerobacillus alkaliphilus]